MGDRAKESSWELRVRFQRGQGPGGQRERMRVKLPEGRVQSWVRTRKERSRASVLSGHRWQLESPVLKAML